MEKGRQDPFADLNEEPVVELGLAHVPSLVRRPTPQGRRTPIRPAERRRRSRKLTVTFSNAGIVARLRALAERWGLTAPGGGPNVSAVVEHLLLPQLEAAEAGEIEGPEGKWGQSERNPTNRENGRF
ncbi:MAG TPA: hypothetical protein G4O00_14490 [Thermoflexia bacterium]|jgi:hypothetical protein|nr:hypothetical protein [Thermoflexia bacterium]